MRWSSGEAARTTYKQRKDLSIIIDLLSIQSRRLRKGLYKRAISCIILVAWDFANVLGSRTMIVFDLYSPIGSRSQI